MDFDLFSYDKYIVSFSGGKDSTALLLFLIDNKVDKSKIELWHQEIDGRGENFFDWEVTPDYCKKLAEAFGVSVFFQWKDGGFKREMLRCNERTAKIFYECPDNTIHSVGGEKGKYSTRLKFPQPSPNLNVRWCSSYLKIDVCAAAIRNQERFNGLRTLVLSGERGEESKQRAGYAILEPDKSDLRYGKKIVRYVDRYRPIRDWTERRIWDLLEKYRVKPHPCYFMGFGRCSCKFCIFGNANQFASAACISHQNFSQLVKFEKEFGYTLKRDTDLSTLIKKGVPYRDITPELARLATSYQYNSDIFIPYTQQWELPAGAFKKCGGPM
jgi:3'-phosphoadenosine 5'-phosphosulfate sulfotransferase (PAPS reductase)/FAD synthetase